ncbi:hypothetical protein A7U60_g6817 [Sanghuangporus baumii]|uniref:Uncharacterized protein n=1 Tax=Sanghuangporus baumii TaxID=108892 RepID=A0A9Q5HUV2_SANBA|nr:hypothetical protein A7U60_g6817 [Sanghuangporus baumii]
MTFRRRSRSRSPIHRKRSLSPEYERDHRRRRDEGKREKDSKPLPRGAQPLTDGDYFLKNAEFRVWLKEEKDRFFDELSGEKARSYFRKFVKVCTEQYVPYDGCTDVYNAFILRFGIAESCRVRIQKTYYSGEAARSQPAVAQTGHRWSFTEKSTRSDKAAIDAARRAVEAATSNKDPEDTDTIANVPTTSHGSRGESSRMIGPTLPSASDRVLSREAQEEAQSAERNYERRRARQEDKNRTEEIVGPKEQGREGMLEKKKMRREADRAARDAKDDTLGEYDDSTLMGGGDSFQARIAQRDAARRRFEEKRVTGREEKETAFQERQEAIRSKDRATMEMFKQMARERFGG